MKRFSGIYLLRDTLVQLLAAFSFSNSTLFVDSEQA